MSDFATQVESHANQAATVGLALTTIADLLGCDGCEHNLSEEHLQGLAHAVQAIGFGIRESGLELFSQVEKERSK